MQQSPPDLFCPTQPGSSSGERLGGDYGLFEEEEELAEESDDGREERNAAATVAASLSPLYSPFMEAISTQCGGPLSMTQPNRCTEPVRIPGRCSQYRMLGLVYVSCLCLKLLGIAELMVQRLNRCCCG